MAKGMDSAPRGDGFLARAVQFPIGIFFLLFFTYLVRPFDFIYLKSGLDPSWMAAATYARQLGLIFGRDFVFTAGPLGILYHRSFDGDLVLPTVAISTVTVLVYSAVLVRELRLGEIRRASLVSAGVVLLAIAAFHLTAIRDNLMLLGCLLLPFHATSGRRSRAIEALLSFLCAAFALAKFSVFPLAVGAVLLTDLIEARRSRAPVCTAVFALAFVGLFTATGGGLSDVMPFVLASIDVARGYSAAMSLSGSAGEILVWIGMVCALLAFILVENRRAWTFPFAMMQLVLALYLWVSLKVGFVRYDIHAVVAWTGLSSAAMIWAVRAAGRNHLAMALLYGALGLGAALGGRLVVFGPGEALLPRPLIALRDTLAQVETGLDLVRSPTQWVAVRSALDTRAREAVRAASPLPMLPGTVDMIPSDQSELIASGLLYRPRPTVQEYTTYSRDQIERNRAFFAGKSAPDFLLMRPGSIDGRHPASAEGALWPLFMERYRPERMIRNYLLLQRREQALAPILGSPVEVEAGFDEPVAFPAPGEPAFVSIDVRPSLLGRLADLVFKRPALSFEVIDSRGAVERYRFVPAIGREGMVLAPPIASAADYALLASGLSPESTEAWPRAVRIVGGSGAAVLYEPRIHFRFQPIALDRLREATPPAPFLQSLLDRVDDLRAARAGMVPNPPLLMAAPEGIFAHAPSAITVPTTGADRLLLAFGIRPGAYSGEGQSDGVCFSVRRAETQLFERCLDPLRTEADRGVVEATVELPPGTTEIVAETRCRLNCQWDWSFWRRLRPAAAPPP